MRNRDASSTSSSDAARIWLALLLPFVAVLAAGGWALYAHRAELAELGRGDGSSDTGALRRLDLVATRRQRFARIAVFGDSLTMCTTPKAGRYDTIARNLKLQIQSGGKPVEVVDLSQPGLLPLFYFTLLDEALALQVELVVIEVNLRTFMDPLARRGEERLPGLARKLAFRESLKVTASLEREGLSVLDPPLMRLKEQLGLLYVLEGAREAGLGWLHDAGEQARTTLGLARRSIPPINEIARRARLSYAVDFGDNPNAAVLRAMFAELRQAEVPFVAYVAPINMDYLRTTKELGDDDIARRIEDLRQDVGASEVEWLDLHDALPASMFRDFQNHMLAPGCVRLARPIAQRILHVLSNRAHQAATPAAARSAQGR